MKPYVSLLLHFLIEHGEISICIIGFVIKLIKFDSSDAYDDPNVLEESIYLYKIILNQKMPLVCYRNGSDEIAGISWTFVKCKEDEFLEKFFATVNCPI